MVPILRAGVQLALIRGCRESLGIARHIICQTFFREDRPEIRSAGF